MNIKVSTTALHYKSTVKYIRIYKCQRTITYSLVTKEHSNGYFLQHKYIIAYYCITLSLFHCLRLSLCLSVSLSSPSPLFLSIYLLSPSISLFFCLSSSLTLPPYLYVYLALPRVISIYRSTSLSSYFTISPFAFFSSIFTFLPLTKTGYKPFAKVYE